MQAPMNTSSSPTTTSKTSLDTNQNVFSVTVDENDGKNDSGRQIVDTQDNIIAKFFYGGPIGYTVNFFLLALTAVYLVLALNWMLNDDELNETVIKAYWLPTIIQFFTIVIPVDLVFCAAIVLIVFPLSRLSRSTFYYWFLGLASSASFIGVLLLLRNHLNFSSRSLLVIDCPRLLMKIAAFLIECNWSEQVHEKSSMKSVLYFLFIPHLVYKHEYPLARRIRWLKVLSHILWLVIGGLAASLLGFHVATFFRIDLMTISSSQLIIVIAAGVVAAIALFPFAAWFFIFDHFCGLHGELLRFPDLKLFGTIPGVLFGRHPTHNLNRVASHWFRRYMFIPAREDGKSHFTGVWYANAFSLSIHDITYFYVGDILIIFSLFMGMTIVPLIMSIKSKRKFIRVIKDHLMFLLLMSWMISYYLEFVAWNYSSMPGVDKLSRFRLTPLHLTQLGHNFFGKPI